MEMQTRKIKRSIQNHIQLKINDLIKELIKLTIYNNCSEYQKTAILKRLKDENQKLNVVLNNRVLVID